MELEVSVDPRFFHVIHDDSMSALMLLREKTSNTAISINIGTDECYSILAVVRNMKRMRPITHDLFQNVLLATGTRVSKVLINKLEDEIFYALLYLIQDGRELTPMDCRPSDGIALALRFGCPIYVDEAVWLEMLEQEDGAELIAQLEELPIPNVEE